jgi:ribosome-associated heat shock protein Hsp15
MTGSASRATACASHDSSTFNQVATSEAPSSASSGGGSVSTPGIVHGACDDGAMVRIDKWLWAARLSKTRGLAAEAVKGGRVEVNGQRVKPSKDVGPGDEIEITSGPYRRIVIVREVAERRGPAREAQLLYEETAESIAARERLAAQRRLEAVPAPRPGGRPTKRDRRRLDARRGRGG